MTKNVFIIDEDCVCSVNITTYYNKLENPDNPTHDDLIKILEGKHRTSVTKNVDHPEFAKLREKLASEGFIRIERGWWNGDRVLRPFTLNGVQFEKEDQFVCGAAMKFHLQFLGDNK